MTATKKTTKPAPAALKTPQVRVLQALAAKGKARNGPALTAAKLAARAGFKAGSGTLSRALHGITPESASVASGIASPYPGLLAAKLVARVEVEVEGATEKAYQITAAGAKALKRHLADAGKPGQARDKELCVNLRYRG